MRRSLRAAHAGGARRIAVVCGAWHVPALDLGAATTPGATADVSTLREATVITVPTASLRRASDACRHSFDRAFLRILVERLSLANTRLTSV